jgi:hypothetical protein
VRAALRGRGDWIVEPESGLWGVQRGEYLTGVLEHLVGWRETHKSAVRIVCVGAQIVAEEASTGHTPTVLRTRQSVATEQKIDTKRTQEGLHPIGGCNL